MLCLELVQYGTGTDLVRIRQNTTVATWPRSLDNVLLYELVTNSFYLACYLQRSAYFWRAFFRPIKDNVGHKGHAKM